MPGSRPTATLLAAAGLVVVLLVVVALPAPAAAQRPVAELAAEVGIDQRLGASLPADLELRDSSGSVVRLGDLLGERPAVLTMVWYECPMLCTQVLNGLVKSLDTTSLEPGTDFDIVTVSIDPGEGPELAAAKKAEYVELYGREGAGRGWHFLTGDAAAVERLARTVGFRYVYDADSDNYAHGSGIMVVTPGGELSRYLYGVEYAPRDLRLALVEAGEGTVGTAADQLLLLLCYRYDPTTGKYGLVIWRVIRLAGVATVLALGIFLVVMLRRERRDGSRLDDGGVDGGGGSSDADEEAPAARRADATGTSGEAS